VNNSNLVSFQTAATNTEVIHVLSEMLTSGTRI